MDSKELKMSVSESDKMGDSLLGNRFSKKAEHLPIKKRRFLFRTPSPPLNSDSSEGPERDAACYNSSSKMVQPNLDASCQPAASTTVADLCQSGSTDSKMDGEKFVEASKKAGEDEDICGISLAASSNGLIGGADTCEVSGIVSYGTQSLEAPNTVKVEANFVIPTNMSTKETDLHIAIAPSKDVTSSILDHSSPDKATVDNNNNTTPDESTFKTSGSHAPSESECSRINQVTYKTQKSADRFNWDLNTVMVAWEEPLERCEQRREHISVSENIGSEILPVVLKSLAHRIEGSEQEERKPDIGKLLSPVICGTSHVAVNKIKSIDAIPMVVPYTIKMESPECDVSAKHVMRERQASPISSPLNKIVTNPLKNTDDISGPMAVGTDLSLDYSIPPSLDPSINISASEGNNVNHAITTVETTECEKLNLSLVTAASPENGVHQGTSTFEVDDKAQVKKEIISNGITMDNFIGKGTESSQDAYRGDSKEVNQTTFGSLLVMPSSVLPEGEDHPAVVSSVAEVPIKSEKSPLTTSSGMTQLTETICHTSHESDTDFPSELVSYNKEVCEEVPLGNGFGYENFPSDIQDGSEVDNIDEFSFGYDSQFEDGELRESSIQTWEEDRENEHGIDNRGTSFHLGTLGGHNNDSECLTERSISRIRSPDVGSQRGTDEISSVLLPEKLDSSDQVSGSEPNETKNGTTEVSMQDANESDQWKMNVSGVDFVPENHNPTNNTTTSKMTDLSSIKFSSRIERHGPETEDLETTKVEGSRFYRREPLSRIGEPSMRDAFLNRGRFKMQGCSSINNANDSDSRSIRESGVMRSLGRGKYSPQVPTSGRGGGPWNRSPRRDRDLNHLRSPPYPGPSFRSRPLLEDVTSVDNLTNEISVDPNDDGRPVVASSYINRQSFRNRLLANREEDEFRARLGLRPSGETYHNRFGNVGRGRSPRYGSRHNGGGPRGQYYAPPASDEYDEPLMEYSHSFPNRRRCLSPTERRENHPCTHHHSGSTSPPRSRTRSPITDDFRRRTSRSPRIRRPRSPNYRRGFEPDHVAGGYSLEPRNNYSPPNSRWVKYKQRSSAFDRRSPPPPPIGERLNFYDPSRKTKPNENYRSGHPGRFSGRGGTRYLGSDGDLTDHGYRRGGFVRRYDMGRPVKHFQYDEEDGYGPVYDSRDKEALVIHNRGNPTQPPYSNGTNSRFPKRPREERENW